VEPARSPAPVRRGRPPIDRVDVRTTTLGRMRYRAVRVVEARCEFVMYNNCVSSIRRMAPLMPEGETTKRGSYKQNAVTV
jgi:hypothetical protein